jgi:hypothetical protein
MARSLEARLEKLEKAPRVGHPGRKAFSDFEYALGVYDLFRWLYRMEVERPDRWPKWYVSHKPAGSSELRSAMSNWRQLRARTWRQEFWTTRWGNPREGDIDGHYRHPGDPDLPSEEKATKLFGYVAASVPPIALEWAHLFMTRLAASPPARIEGRTLGGYMRATELLILESRILYWRRRLGPQKLDQIAEPPWASQAHRGGHGG